MSALHLPKEDIAIIQFATGRLWRKAAIANGRPSKGVISRISMWLKTDICQLLIHRNSAPSRHCYSMQTAELASHSGNARTRGSVVRSIDSRNEEMGHGAWSRHRP
jgi:hypothetical protein